MPKKHLAGRFLCTTMLTGAVAAAALPAFAQDYDVDDVIIVTGSRLNQANLSSSSPVFQLDAGEIDTRGATRIEDLINILPQVFAAQTSEVSNDATGTSQANLRNLGSIRTLVLLDGKRLPFGSAQTSSPNLDFIPTQLVERVEIVTGGASAVYGSDAMAGVVNFILRRNFEGVMFDGQVGFYQDANDNDFAHAVLSVGSQPIPSAVTDGRDVMTSVMIGANTKDGRGNVTAYFSYQDQNEIRQDARDYSACTFGTTPPGPETINGISCSGSATFRSFFYPLTFSNVFQEEDGTLVPFVFGPSTTFNFAPDNFIQRPNERFNITALARYEITDNIEAYLDTSFVNNTTDAQVAFSGSFFRPFMVNCDNPLLGSGPNSHFELAGCAATPTADVPIFFGRRNVEGDPRNAFIETNSWRMVGGFRGDIDDGALLWDAYGVFARTRLTRISEGDLNFAKVQEALFAVDDGFGNVVCRPPFRSDCVPWNVFQRGPNSESLVTREQTDFIQGAGLINGTTQQLLIGGTIQGDLADFGFQFPWSDVGVQGLLGLEWRKDQLEKLPDELSRIPGGRGLTGVGFGQLPLKGELRVTEAFMETQIPLITGKPMFEELGINGAYRLSDYTTDGNDIMNSFQTHTFAAGVSWAPSHDVRFRGQFQRAVRAPNVQELFTGLESGGFNPLGRPPLPGELLDPCAGDFDPATPPPPPTAPFAICALTGVTAAQYGAIPDSPIGALNATFGGNPLLNAEKADTYTVGMVLTPEFLPGFKLAVDYFDITINGAIAGVPPLATFDRCFTNGEPLFCDLIVRDRFGTLWLDNSNFEGIQSVRINIGGLATRGLDVNANYNVDVPFTSQLGSMTFSYAASIMFENSFVPLPGVDVIECKGLYGERACFGAPNNAYRHRFMTTWQTPWNIDLTFTHRYYSGVDFREAPSGNGIDDHLDSANYLDLAAQWHMREGVELRAGVQNVFGRDPELSSSCPGPPICNGNTLPGVYDSAGRFLFVGVNLSH